MDQEITRFDFPAAFPGIGGNKFTCWMPSFPILFDFSFAGYVLFGGGYKPVGYMNDSGNPDPEYWKKSPRESGAKQAHRCDQYDDQRIHSFLPLSFFHSATGSER